MTFEAFPKIHRLSREIIVTEKIDGTNAQVIVQPPEAANDNFDARWRRENVVAKVDGYDVFAGSRTRLITPQNDNFGFARWVHDNALELARGLGVGRHYGEWWGLGIQRGYGLKEKRFSLFNVARWGEARPACCHVVPVLFRGMFSTIQVGAVLDALSVCGSQAALGFMKPEGVVIFHVAGNVMFKKTIEKDDEPKRMAA